MVKVILQVDGEADEVITAIRRLAGGDGVALSAPPPAPEVSEEAPEVVPEVVVEPVVPEGEWNADRVRTFWEFLAQDAREIYRSVAQRRDYVISRDSLLDSMHLTARELSGRLSSQGHAVRRIRRHHNVSLPHPMSFDSASEEYRMRSDVGEVIVNLDL